MVSANAGLCRHCLFDHVKARGLCSACYEHERKFQVPRPATAILRRIDRIIWGIRTET